jgi:cyclic pyranopterin monophosphate synthase
MAGRLSHVDGRGAVRMVDVSAKRVTARVARARGCIRMLPETARLLAAQQIAKGNVLEAARLAGIMAAKRTAQLVPLCHTVDLTGIDLSFLTGDDRVLVEVQARTRARTGVEMEALVAATAALLTIYDMCKAVDRGMVIGEVRLVEKRGGRTGPYERPEEPLAELSPPARLRSR